MVLSPKSKHFHSFWALLFILLLGACASHRKAQARKEKVETVISTARSYTGTPYKYGGTTRAGIDCSALVYHSFSSININLPRTSESQGKVGQEVKRKELAPGDLVFFATGKRKRKITHAGIVTEVMGNENIKFIHASTTLGVIETDMQSDYYRKRFRLGRRVIN